MSLIAAIEKLHKFSDQVDISKLVTDLNGLTSSVIVEDAVIEDLRKRLIILLSQSGVKKEEISLADVAYGVLLALARLKPLNIEDPITLEAILPEDSVFISTGQQFSITSLIHQHNTRESRDTTLGESAIDKWLIDPVTNIKFCPMDVDHIMTVATEKRIIIYNLKTKVTVPHPEFDVSGGEYYERRVTPVARAAHRQDDRLTRAIAALPAAVPPLDLGMGFLCLLIQQRFFNRDKSAAESSSTPASNAGAGVPQR